MAGWILLTVGFGFLNAIFATAFFSAVGDSIVGGFGMATMLAMLGYLYYQTIVRCYALIHHAPAMVSGLIGAPDLNRQDDSHSERSHGTAIAFIKTGGAGLKNNLSTGASARGAAKKQAEDRKKADAAAAAAAQNTTTPQPKSGDDDSIKKR